MYHLLLLSMTGANEQSAAAGGLLTNFNHQRTLELNEAQARYILIDPELRRSGWKLDDHTQVLREVPVDGYDATPWNGVTDYCFYKPSGDVIAVVEAKRTCRNPREGEEQLRHYVTEIAKRQTFVPFGFLTNGLLTYFWDVGAAHPRLVAGMFSPDDLERHFATLATRHERLPTTQREALRQAERLFQTLLHRAVSEPS